MDDNNKNNSTILNTVLKSQISLQESMSSINDKIGDLLIIESARNEREITQEKENDKFNIFIKRFEQPLFRLERQQKIYDSASIKLVIILVTFVVGAAVKKTLIG